MARGISHWSRWLFSLAMPALATLPVTATAATAVPTIRLASSSTATAFARDALLPLKQERKLEVTITTAGSETDLDEVRAGRADAALVSRPLTPEEAVAFRATVLGTDRLLLIVNERNPLNVIDEKTVRGIFQRQLSDWRQIGAGNTGTIVPVTRSPTHGTRTLFDNRFAIGRIVPTGIVELASNLATVLYIGADPQAIGYVSAGTFDDARQRGLRIKAVLLKDAPPDKENCPGNGHLLCRPISLVRLQGRATPAYQTLESFLTSPAGQALQEQHGLSPVPRP